MNVVDAMELRRSIKKFSDRPVLREQLEPLLDAAVLAPNHHLSQPWRFYVLGAAARGAYGEALGARKARRLEDAAAARALIAKVGAEHAALPSMIAVAMVQDENPERREEDYAAVMMAVQNLSLAAVAAGLGTHIRTGAVMEDPAARAAVGVAADERIVAVINVGYPEEQPPRREREPAAANTVWVP